MSVTGTIAGNVAIAWGNRFTCPAIQLRVMQISLSRPVEKSHILDSCLSVGLPEG